MEIERDGKVKILKLWLPVLVWAGIIYWFSGIPGLKTNFESDFILRNIAHILEYFILTLLLRRAFKGSFLMGVLALFLYPALISFVYALSDEFHQSFVMNRNSSPHDIAMDTIGILGFYGIGWIRAALDHKKKHPPSKA